MRKLIKRITKFHIRQSLMAGIYIFIVFNAMHSLHSDLTVASLGASAFIVFSFPHKQSSRPRFLIGGYSAGIISGLIGYGLRVFISDFITFPGYIFACTLAIVLSMLLMTVLNYEHPPSAALAIAIASAANTNPVLLGVISLVSVTALSITKELLKKHMRDL